MYQIDLTYTCFCFFIDLTFLSKKYNIRIFIVGYFIKLPYIFYG